MLIAIFIALLVIIALLGATLYLFWQFMQELVSSTNALACISEPLRHHAESLARLSQPQGPHGPIG